MKLSALVEELNTTGEAISITRNGRTAAVMVTPEEYEAWQETLEVLADPSMVAGIQKSLENYTEGKFVEISLDELDQI